MTQSSSLVRKIKKGTMKIFKATGMKNLNTPHQQEVQTLCRTDFLNTYDRTLIAMTLNLLTTQLILSLTSYRSERYMMTLGLSPLTFVLITKFEKVKGGSGTSLCSFIKISSWVKGRKHYSNFHWRSHQILEKPMMAHGNPSTLGCCCPQSRSQ